MRRRRSRGATACWSRSGDDGREHVGPRTRVIDGAGLAVVPGLTDSHIHPFWGTRSTRGVDLRSAETLDEVRGAARGERGAAGREWVLGHSVALRAVPRRRAPGRRDRGRARRRARRWSLLRRPHRARVAGRRCAARASTARASSAEYGGDRRRRRRHARPARCSRTRAMDLVRRGRARTGPRPSALDAYAATLRRLNARRPHRRARDGRRPGAARRRAGARGARRPDACGCVMPMHQAPSITDEEVEERLRSPASAGGCGGRAPRSSSSTACSTPAPRGSSTPAPDGVNAHPFWPSVERYAELVAPLHARPASARSRTRSATARSTARSTPTRRPGRRGAACTASSTSRRCSTRTCRASPRSTSPRRCSRCTWRASTTRTRRARGSTACRRAAPSAASAPATSPRAARRSRSARTGWSPTSTRASGWRGRGCGARRAAGPRPYLPDQALSARADAARLHDRTPRGSTATSSVYGRLRPGPARRHHRARAGPGRRRPGRAAGRAGAADGGRRPRRLRGKLSGCAGTRIACSGCHTAPRRPSSSRPTGG